MTRKLTDDERKLIAKLIDDAAKSGKLSKVSIAGKAGYDERTVRSVLAGNTASFETSEPAELVALWRAFLATAAPRLLAPGISYGLPP